MTSTPAHASTVFVAGGSGVIGGAICRSFGEHQWQVGIQYFHNSTSAEHTAQAIHQAGGLATLYEANVQDHAHTHAMVQHFIERHERLDVLIWAIGISENHFLVRATSESWVKQMSINLTGCFQFLKSAAPIFERQRFGSVVIVSSLSGLQGTTGQVAYATSKAGLIGLMKSVAKEWAPWNIRVNAVFPGWHISPLSGSAFPNEDELHHHLLKKTPATKDIAKAVYDLAIMEGLSGQIWNLDSRIF